LKYVTTKSLTTYSWRQRQYFTFQLKIFNQNWNEEVSLYLQRHLISSRICECFWC